MNSVSSAPPAGRRKHVPPTSPAALLNAFGYAFGGAAVAAILTITLMRLFGYIIPLVGVIIEFVAWAAIIKYALEVLHASGLGKDHAPDVLSHVDAGVHTRHVLVQILVLLAIVVAIILFPSAVHGVIIGAALILPGLVFSLTVAQNLIAALNPLNWGVIVARLGLGYPMLAIGWGALLYYQLLGFDLFEALPRWLALSGFYLLNHYLLIVLFRWQGMFLAYHADQLGFDQTQAERPVLQRQREQSAIASEIREANELGDPRLRADRLHEAIRRGASIEVNLAYRKALRECGDREALLKHAQVHASELIELEHVRPAIALVQEAMQDDARFCLPDARQLNRLLDVLERQAQWRSAASLALNYRHTYPKRIDGLALAERAAGILAERLGDPETARELIAAALPQAAGFPIEEALRKRWNDLGGR
ncbi:hypothetical protein [Pseudomarimonas arenosa]|uniref:Uncharacterized protein n=1 Tax=Pseudomarimonas arenosa TaxID=2774145 RepID=A0AAW3ZMC3_9GAMM|nr:hypothetical protein [Pseudomarimonas arenosa]MBD8527113.1 hypothetical protein [Pseudomarimonas arenosa]